MPVDPPYDDSCAPRGWGLASCSCPVAAAAMMTWMGACIHHAACPAPMTAAARLLVLHTHSNRGGDHHSAERQPCKRVHVRLRLAGGAPK
jgi:hypothetical protein